MLDLPGHITRRPWRDEWCSFAHCLLANRWIIGALSGMFGALRKEIPEKRELSRFDGAIIAGLDHHLTFGA